MFNIIDSIIYIKKIFFIFTNPAQTMYYKNLLFIAIFSMIISCKTRSKESTLNYMKNIEQIATDTSEKSTTGTLQSGDQLLIQITAKDMNVVKPFNQNYYSGEISQSSVTGITTNQVANPGYIIDLNGYIDFPVLGIVKASEKTLMQLKEEIKEKVSEYVKDPVVNIRITNYKVTILGDVARPGQYSIPDAQTTILNALGLAGDLTIYGDRTNILIVRNENGVISKEYLNLQDANFINSPYYNLKQGDVIYVSGNQTKEKISRIDPNTGLILTAASVAIGAIAIFISLLK